MTIIIYIYNVQYIFIYVSDWYYCSDWMNWTLLLLYLMKRERMNTLDIIIQCNYTYLIYKIMFLDLIFVIKIAQLKQKNIRLLSLAKK